MNIFKDSNDWNEKSIIGFVAFLIMCLIMVADLVTGWVGKDLIINEFVYDTIVEIETQYVEIFVIDSVVEYIEVINTEYVDCDSGLPCNSAIEEIIDKSKGSSVMYNLLGQPIKKPKGVYIENGKIKYLAK